MSTPTSVSSWGRERGYVARRVGAVLLDLSLAAFAALAVLVVWVVLIALTIWLGGPGDPGIEEWNYLALLGLLLYYVPLKGIWGTTIGDHAFGLATRRQHSSDRETGTAVGRVGRFEVRAKHLGLAALGRLASVDDLDRTAHEWRAHAGVGADTAQPIHRNRAAAAAIDLFAALVAWTVGVSGMAVIAGTIEAASDAGLPISLAGNPIWYGSLYAVMIVWPIGYFVVCEIRYGTTIGKWQYGLVVTDTDGELPSLRAILVRNVLRPVDLLGGALLALVTDRRRRLGDLVAGTVVSSIER